MFVVVAVVVLYRMIRGSICGNGHKERVVCQMMSVNIGRIQASILRESIAPHTWWSGETSLLFPLMSTPPTTDTSAPVEVTLLPLSHSLRRTLNQILGDQGHQDGDYGIRTSESFDEPIHREGVGSSQRVPRMLLSPLFMSLC